MANAAAERLLSGCQQAVVEVCCDSLESASIALRSGAHRIELCIALGVGGVTPTTSFVRAVLLDRDSLGSDSQVGVLIRPRDGDFVYSKREQQVMCDDIKAFRQLGVDFVAVGALQEDGGLDLAAMGSMLHEARATHCTEEPRAAMDVVCHRCVDAAEDYAAAVKAALGAGCCRVLTSGGAASALEGAAAISALLAEGGVTPSQVCAASGISVDTTPALLLAAPELQQVHGSFRGPVVRGTSHRGVLPGDVAGLRVCDATCVASMLAIMLPAV